MSDTIMAEGIQLESASKQSAQWAGAKLIPSLSLLALGSLFWFMDPPEGLTLQAWHLMIIFLTTIAAVILKPLPMGAISIIATAFCVVTRNSESEHSPNQQGSDLTLRGYKSINESKRLHLCLALPGPGANKSYSSYLFARHRHLRARAHLSLDIFWSGPGRLECGQVWARTVWAWVPWGPCLFGAGTV